MCATYHALIVDYYSTAVVGIIPTRRRRQMMMMMPMPDNMNSKRPARGGCGATKTFRQYCTDDTEPHKFLKSSLFASIVVISHSTSVPET